MDKVHETDFGHVDCLFIIDLYGGGPKSGGGELISAKRLYIITLSPGYAFSKEEAGNSHTSAAFSFGVHFLHQSRTSKFFLWGGRQATSNQHNSLQQQVHAVCSYKQKTKQGQETKNPGSD